MNNRQKEITNKLLTEKDYVTVAQIAILFEISNRTVHYDLEVIEVYLKHYGIVIDKKRSIGVRVIGETNSIQEAMKSLGYQVDQDTMEATERLTKIFKLLVIDKEYVTIQQLSEMFYVSSSSIIRDFQTIRTILSKNTCVDIISDRTGSYSEGTELQIQTSIHTFQLHILNRIYGKQYDEFEVLTYLKVMYEESFVDVVVDILRESCNLENKPIAAHYLVNLYSSVIILVERLKRNHHIQHFKSPMLLNDEIKQLETYLMAQEIINKITNKIGVEAEIEDVKYLNSLLISSGIHVSMLDTGGDSITLNLVDELIVRVSKLIDFDLTTDKRLRESLVAHFKPMIYRNAHGIEVKNPILDEILKDYAVLYSLIFLAIKDIDHIDLRDLSRDEVSFLLVYFQTSIERNIKIQKVLLVCPNGIGSSELLMYRLKRYLPPLDIVEVSSIERLKEINVKEFDFVISTVNLQLDNIEVIKVSPLLSDEELKKINSYYLSEFSLDAKDLLDLNSTNVYNSIVDEESIYLDTEFKTSEEVLSFLSKETKKHGIAKDGFMKNILNRESIEPTSLWSGAAIPHANPVYVNKTRVYILCNKEPLQWGQIKVKLVFLFCISEKDLNLSRSIVGGLHKILGSKDQVEQFIRLSKKEMLNMLKGKINYDK